MTERDRDAERRIDEANKESFPASDPPTFTPPSGVGQHPDEPDEETRERRTAAAESVERRRDPHGAQPAEEADQDEPKGAPTPDRQRTETTVERVKKDRD